MVCAHTFILQGEARESSGGIWGVRGSIKLSIPARTDLQFDKKHTAPTGITLPEVHLLLHHLL